MLFFLLRFRLPSQFFLRVKGKAQISICPSIGIAILKPTFSNTKPVLWDLEKLKAFGFGLYWV
jgi:hypothetical protein